MADRYHKAAQDGNLEVLKETTKKDTNIKNEDGMTPTLWAAFEGNLEALKLLIGRGGNPEKCDNYGNTGLHLAAAKGHLKCVSYLINFGVNMYCLDIDMHTPQELAAMNDFTDILQFMDAIHSQREAEDARKVKKLQEQAEKDALKLKKNFQKVKEKADKLASKSRKNLDEEKKKKMVVGEETLDDSITVLHRDSIAVHQHFSEMVGVSNAPSDSAGKKLMGTVFRKAPVKKKAIQPQTFKVRSTQMDGTKTLRNLSGLRRDSEIMFVAPIMEDDLDASIDPGSRLRRDTFGIFDRPGFGEVAFRRDSMAATFLAVGKDAGSDGERASSRLSREDGSNDSGDDGSSGPDDPAINLFLAGLGLADYIPVFRKQKIDLETLMELTESNLLEMQIEIGPRKKILKAIKERKQDLAQDQAIEDSAL